MRTHAEEAKANGSFGQTPLDFDELTDLIRQSSTVSSIWTSVYVRSCRMVNDSDIVDFQIENKGVNLSIKKAEAMEEKIHVRTQNCVR